MRTSVRLLSFATTLAALFALCAGCDVPRNPVANAPDQDARTAPADPHPVASQAASAPAIADTTPADPDDGSRYTGLAERDCKVTDVDKEAGGSTSSCPGLGGYRLVLHDSDARMTLDVIAPDGSRHPLRLSSVISSAFSSLGPRAEWRFARGQDVPVALIVRFDAYEYPEQPERRRSYLAVARLGGKGACVIARVEPGPDQNLRARRSADRAADAACLEPGGR